MDVAALRPDDHPPGGSAARTPNELPCSPPQSRIRLAKQDQPAVSADLSTRWEAINGEGTRHFLEGRFGPAYSVFEAALDVARNLASNDLRLATSLNNLGETCRTMGLFDQAQPLLEEALAQRERVLGARHPHVARSRNNLGFLHESRGEYFEAFGHYRDAFDAMSRQPSAYPGELTSTLMHLARLAGICNAHEVARRLHEAACEVMGVCIDTDDPDSGLQLYFSGQIHEMGQRYRDAWHCYRSALRVLSSALGTDHYLLAPILAGMGRTLRARGHGALAERVLHRALAILEATFEPPHHEMAGVLNSLAELYRTTGRGGLAELLYRRALKMAEGTLGETHPDVAAVLCNLAMMHEERGEPQKATELLAQMQRIDAAVQFPPAEAFAKLNVAAIGR
jgi:tetratricopeptide (TPR) repeat protein